MQSKDKINNNGFEYVDLGLPSGTLWASCNIGASKPSNSGLYFQWGDTVGYTADQIGNGDGKKLFSIDWIDYKWYLSGNGFGEKLKFTKYDTPGATLDLEDDAANVNMGGDWHMPTPKQIQELLDNTTSAWTTLDGVNGYLFTSNKDSSKSIFIPAAGYAWEGLIDFIGDYGSIWSSMISEDHVNCGHSLDFHSGWAYPDDYDGIRCDGLPVRGVIG